MVTDRNNSFVSIKLELVDLIGKRTHVEMESFPVDEFAACEVPMLDVFKKLYFKTRDEIRTPSTPKEGTNS